MNKFVIAALATAVIIPSAAMAKPFDRHDERPAATKVVVIDRHDTRDHERRRPAVVNRIAVGQKLDARFIARQDTIRHPVRYKLAKPARNAQWLKIRDDAVLVNVNNGKVLRIAHNIFR